MGFLSKPFGMGVFKVEVGRDWEISSFGFSRGGGIVALSDIEFGERFIVKWEPGRTVDVDRSIEAMAKKLKTVNVYKTGFTSIRGHKCGKFRIQEEDAQGMGGIWHCDVSGLNFLVYYRSQSPKDAEETLNNILQKFRCHWRGEYEYWTLLNLEFKTPKGFVVSKLELRVGESKALLKGGRKFFILYRWHFPEKIKIKDVERKVREAEKMVGRKFIEEWTEEKNIRGFHVVSRGLKYYVRDALLRKRRGECRVYFWKDFTIGRAFALLVIYPPGEGVATFTSRFWESVRVLS